MTGLQKEWGGDGEALGRVVGRGLGLRVGRRVGLRVGGGIGWTLREPGDGREKLPIAHAFVSFALL